MPASVKDNPWRDPSTIWLRYPQLDEHGVTYSRQHLTVLERQGRFPRRYRLSDRVIAWRLSEVLEWLASRGRE